MSSSDKEKVLSIIKSCIVSATDPLPLDALLRDYRELVGENIPFSKFNHPSLQSFLSSEKQYVSVSNRGGRIVCAAPHTADTSHITNLVKGQRKSKSRTSFIRKPPPRRNYSSWVPPSSTQRSNTRRNYSRPLLSTPNNTRSNNYGPPISGNNYNYREANQFNPPWPSRDNYDAPKTYNHRPPCAREPKYIPNNPRPVRPQQNRYQQQTPRFVNNDYGNVATGMNYQREQRPQMTAPPKPSPVLPTANIRQNYNTHSTQPLRAVNNIRSTPPLRTVNNIQSTPPVQTSKQQLEKIAAEKNLPLIFNCITWGKANVFHLATVTCIGKKANSYPIEAVTKAEAEEVAAKKMLDIVKIFAEASTIPITKDFDIVFKRVKKILDACDGPVWFHLVKKVYGEEHKELIPEGWIIKAKKDIKSISFMQPTNDTDWILQSIEVQEQEEAKKLPPLLTLPKADIWEVYVTYVKDTGDVGFRLLEEQYVEPYEALLTDMELYYMEENKQEVPKCLEIGQYYTCNFDSSWLRAQLLKIDGDTADILFIDDGDTEVMPKSDLFVIKEEFLKLPAQCVSVSLAGLEFCPQDPALLNDLNCSTLGKELIAEVYSRQDGVISVVLFDTQSDSDKNINEELLKLLPSTFSNPQFPEEGGICEVYITNVSDSGVLSLHIESATYRILESFLEELKKQKYFIGDENLSIDIKNLYLARFSEDGEWHRAAPRSALKDSHGRVLLECIDSSTCSWVAATNVLPVENFIECVRQIPKQALHCRLNDVPSQPSLSWTLETSNRLRSLLPSKGPVLLKVINESCDDGLTTVEVFKRLESKNELVSVNATLSVDKNLFKKTEASIKHVANTVSADASRTEISLPLGVLLPVPLPDLNRYFDVVVVMASHPSNFIVQPYRYYNELCELNSNMNEFYSSETNLESLEVVQRGGDYAYQHPDGCWYRVRITKFDGPTVMGYLVDYGECFLSNIASIQRLCFKFMQLPCQAMKAKLTGVVPIRGHWTAEDGHEFHELVAAKCFVSEAVAYGSDRDEIGSPVLELTLIDTSDADKDIFIHKCLIDRKIAAAPR